MLALKPCTATKNFCCIDDPRIFNQSHTGRGKIVIERFKNCVTDSLHWLSNNSNWLLDQKISFFGSRKRSLGRTALCLSGGGSLSMYHMGVVRCMIEQNCLPNIISGTSGGSIVAALVAIHSNDELLQIINEKISNLHLPHKWFDTIFNQIVHFATNGVLMDYKVFTATVEAFFGMYTFEEAFNRTGRIVNICVTTSSASGRTKGSSLLLNHLTTPHVLISSAVVTSCALPGLMVPVELMTKTASGVIQPYLQNSKFVDGSLQVFHSTLFSD